MIDEVVVAFAADGEGNNVDELVVDTACKDLEPSDVTCVVVGEAAEGLAEVAAVHEPNVVGDDFVDVDDEDVVEVVASTWERYLIAGAVVAPFLVVVLKKE